MIADFERLVAAVQANCHVADARFARDMGLCTYLLEMRELYRWEQGAAPTAVLPQAAVGAWLSGREAMWGAIEEAELQGLPLDGTTVDPFDVDTMNRVLVPHGLVYGAGVGRFGKPQFFLAALDREEQRDGVRILVARREHARDLGAAAAACRGDTDLPAARVAAAIAVGEGRDVGGQASRRAAAGCARRLRFPGWRRGCAGEDDGRRGRDIDAARTRRGPRRAAPWPAVGEHAGVADGSARRVAGARCPRPSRRLPRHAADAAFAQRLAFTALLVRQPRRHAAGDRAGDDRRVRGMAQR